jgi:exosome complex exonuclease RRP6
MRNTSSPLKIVTPLNKMNSSIAFKSLQERVSASLVDTTRTAGHIAAEDLSFHRSLSASIALKLDRQNGRLLDIAGKLTKAAVLNSEVNAPQLNSVDAVEENWQGVVDVIDSLLEKADACLDEYTGVVKRLSPAPPEQIPTSTVRSTRPTRSFRDQDIPKPQLLFARVPRNDESTPFKPLLRSKPHAILPLDQSLEMIDNDEGRKQYDKPSVRFRAARKLRRTGIDAPTGTNTRTRRR